MLITASQCKVVSTMHHVLSPPVIGSACFLPCPMDSLRSKLFHSPVQNTCTCAKRENDGWILEILYTHAAFIACMILPKMCFSGWNQSVLQTYLTNNSFFNIFKLCGVSVLFPVLFTWLGCHFIHRSVSNILYVCFMVLMHTLYLIISFKFSKVTGFAK